MTPTYMAISTRSTLRCLRLALPRAPPARTFAVSTTCSSSWAAPRTALSARSASSTSLGRSYAASTTQTLSIAPITEQQYAQLSDQAMDTLHDSLEELVEGDEGAHGGWEVEYNESHCKKSGVLTLIMGSHGTYVINKQPPNKQIWLSSPVSGPKRFDFSAETGEWFYPRDGSLLGGLLEAELSEMAGRQVELGLLAREP